MRQVHTEQGQALPVTIVRTQAFPSSAGPFLPSALLPSIQPTARMRSVNSISTKLIFTHDRYKWQVSVLGNVLSYWL